MPRKKPKQARSQATVDALVEATGLVLQSSGPRKTNTNAVAKRAGVSIGSLYQYFPDKKGLIAAYFERRIAEDLALMQRVVEQGPSAAPVVLIRTVSSEMLRLIKEELALYRGVVELLPMMDQTEEVQRGLEQGVTLLASLLRSSAMGNDLTPDQAEATARMTFIGTRAAVFSLVQHAPEALDDPTLAERLAAGALGFLGHPCPADRALESEPSES